MDKSLIDNLFTGTPYKAVDAVPFPVNPRHVWLINNWCGQIDYSDRIEIESKLIEKGYELKCYDWVMPNLSAESIEYNFPGLDIDVDDLCEEAFNQAVAEALGLKMKLGFRYLVRYDQEADTFYVVEIELPGCPDESRIMRKAVKDIFDLGRDGDIRFSMRKSSRASGVEVIEGEAIPPVGRPTRSEKDLQKLAEEVEAKIALLVMDDFPTSVIEAWIQKAVKLSRLKITSDWRILLTDYGKEVKMRQLPKALFFFFLKHPEGCRVADLQDHKDEIYAIYKKLTIHENIFSIKKRIKDLVDPFGNSYSEKSAAVKLAFKSEIADNIAQNYYIHGPQGGVKSISLDRSLVEWEVEV
jgi:hypothetical protein